jgi:hypothetical protein
VKRPDTPRRTRARAKVWLYLALFGPGDDGDGPTDDSASDASGDDATDDSAPDASGDDATDDSPPDADGDDATRGDPSAE